MSKMSTHPSTKTIWTEESAPSKYEVHDRTATFKLGYLPLIRDLKTTHGTDITLLDYGCGPGLTARQFAEEKIRHIEAVDVSADAVKKAIRLSSHKSINYQPIINAELPFPNDHFDAAICCYVLISIHNRDQFANVFREIYRVLKPGGTFYILDINPDQTGVPYPTFQTGDTGVVYKDGDSRPSYLKLTNGDTWKIIDTYWARSTYENNFHAAGFTNLQVSECNGSHLPLEERKSLLCNNIHESPFLIFKATKPLKV